MAAVRFVASGDGKRALTARDDSEAACAVGDWESWDNTRMSQIADIMEYDRNRGGDLSTNLGVLVKDNVAYSGFYHRDLRCKQPNQR